MALRLYFFDFFLVLAKIYSSNVQGFHHFSNYLKKNLATLLPPWSIANGLHLKPTVKIFLSLLCILQMGVVSFAVVSPEVHELCCEDRCNANRLDSVNQQKHTDDEHHDDHEPLEEHFCPVFVYSHGITIPDILIYNDWAYSAFKLIAFFEPNSFSPVSSALDKKQRAPPLV